MIGSVLVILVIIALRVESELVLDAVLDRLGDEIEQAQRQWIALHDAVFRDKFLITANHWDWLSVHQTEHGQEFWCCMTESVRNRISAAISESVLGIQGEHNVRFHLIGLMMDDFAESVHHSLSPAA